jgi:hypothetical protein
MALNSPSQQVPGSLQEEVMARRFLQQQLLMLQPAALETDYPGRRRTGESKRREVCILLLPISASSSSPSPTPQRQQRQHQQQRLPQQHKRSLAPQSRTRYSTRMAAAIEEDVTAVVAQYAATSGGRSSGCNGRCGSGDSFYAAAAVATPKPSLAGCSDGCWPGCSRLAGTLAAVIPGQGLLGSCGPSPVRSAGALLMRCRRYSSACSSGFRRTRVSSSSCCCNTSSH